MVAAAAANASSASPSASSPTKERLRDGAARVFEPGSLPSGTPPLSPDGIRQALTQANLARVRKQWAEAVDHCVAVLRADAASQTAHSLLGDIYRDQGKTEEAIQWYRMALELGASTADEAKLKELERAQARAIGSAAQSGNRKASASATPALRADSPVPGGTANLMGLSPRRWLRGLTVISVGFLALMIVLLVVLRPNRAVTALPRPSNQGLPPSNVNTGRNGVLPPARPGGAPVMPEGTQNTHPQSGGAEAGGGFAPDLGSAPGSGAAANVGRNPAATNRPLQQGNPAGDVQNGPSSTGVPTAPVQGVRPRNPDAESGPPAEEPPGGEGSPNTFPSPNYYPENRPR